MNQTKNEENGIICTHGAQHGVLHRGGCDVASEGYVLKAQRLSPGRFEPVAFAIGGVALATPYKNAKMPKLLAWSTTSSHFFSHEPNSFDSIFYGLEIL